GKRGVKQLSVFEMVIIIALGSAVGDPMLYENVGLLPGISVIIIVIILYRVITILASKFEPLERFVEGQPKLIIQNGQMVLENLKKEHLTQDEFFSQLRLKSVEHLGQIKHAYLETTGDISVYFKENDQVSYGLPIRPELVHACSSELLKPAYYSCTCCGYSIYLEAFTNTCEICKKNEWVESIHTIRIA
ncbi:MAG: YetF domain-containing protein, partial [Xanthomarina sp.]